MGCRTHSHLCPHVRTRVVSAFLAALWVPSEEVSWRHVSGRVCCGHDSFRHGAHGAIVVILSLLFSQFAAANEFDPNSEPLVVLSLVHQGGSDAPWGVEFGAEYLFALGDTCAWSEGLDCHTGAWWPTLGPRATLTWRGADRLGLDFEAMGGVAAVDGHQFGFFPIFELDATVGGALEWGSPPAFTLGARTSKSLSYTRNTPSHGGIEHRTYGLELVSATFALEEHWSAEPRNTQWTTGLQMATQAADYE